MLDDIAKTGHCGVMGHYPEEGTSISTSIVIHQLRVGHRTVHIQRFSGFKFQASDLPRAATHHSTGK
jgi:hypothetical protein